jgi:hypothetical protein
LDEVMVGSLKRVRGKKILNAKDAVRGRSRHVSRREKTRELVKLFLYLDSNNSKSWCRGGLSLYHCLRRESVRAASEIMRLSEFD